jgi:tetraacyldisaccharide 4'-kinase
MGGTGKTPLVQYITRMLLARGLKPAIISRGYGGRAKGPVNVVSDRQQLYLEAYLAGDEPRLLAETLPGVPVLTGIVRKLSAIRAIRDGADVLVLDDGFQHLGVGRDLDLVLFNADSLAGNSRVFPGGDLREPVAALKRCHAFVLTSTCTRNEERARRFGELLETKFPGRPVFLSRYTPSSFVERTQEGSIRKVSAVTYGRIYVFCGIARPEAFRQTLEDMQVEFCGMQIFSDHHQYQQVDIKSITAKASELGAKVLLTTEKDLVKLKNAQFDLPLIAVRMEVKLESSFDDFVLKQLGSL